MLAGIGIFPGKGGGDEGRDHTSALLAGMGQEVAGKIGPVVLAGAIEGSGGGGLEAFVAVRDHQLDAS